MKSLVEETGFRETGVFCHSLGRETRFLLLQGILTTGFLETGVFWHSLGLETRFLLLQEILATGFLEICVFWQGKLISVEE